MTEEQNQTTVPALADVVTGQAELDVNSLDLKNLPEDISKLKFQMPNHGVKRPLWKIFLTGLYNYPKPKVNKQWFNGQLLTDEEYAKIPEEERFAYRNKITKAKR